MKALLDVIWGLVIASWLVFGVYSINWWGCWSLAWFVGGPLVTHWVRWASWWLRCRSYRRLVDELCDDGELEIAA